MSEPLTRRALDGDLAVVASWLRSAEDCRLWAGARVAFPIDRAALPTAIELPVAESWSLVHAEEVVGFGQIVPKPAGRRHLARLICCPRRRGEGLGRRLAQHLLERALASAPSAVSLNVARDNAPAVRLYRALGFEEAKRPQDEAPSPSVYMEYARTRRARR